MDYKTPQNASRELLQEFAQRYAEQFRQYQERESEEALTARLRELVSEGHFRFTLEERAEIRRRDKMEKDALDKSFPLDASV